jgi:anaphase-promoting complex subunit 10
VGTWSISSCKPGFGVEQLRDNNLETYWQSDASQPHTISIQFTHKQLISDILLYVDYKQDESYTPQKISVRIGSNFNDIYV